MGSAHRLTERTFDQSLMKIVQMVQEIQSWHEIQGSNLWPWTVTLTLCGHGWVMSFAHRLTEANIWPKFKENPSMGRRIFQRVQEIWSGQESVTEGLTDGRTNGQIDRRTDEGHFYNPPSASRRGIKKRIKKSYNKTNDAFFWGVSSRKWCSPALPRWASLPPVDKSWC